jgi:protease I
MGESAAVNLHEPASRIGVDKTVEEANPADYDALLLPGGFINPDLLRQSQRAGEFVRAFDAAGKPIASLCHGPWVLEVGPCARMFRDVSDEPWRMDQ